MVKLLNEQIEGIFGNVMISTSAIKIDYTIFMWILYLIFLLDGNFGQNLSSQSELLIYVI